MRPSRTVARAVLTAALALGALPGLALSHQSSPDRPIDAAAFRQVSLASTFDRTGNTIATVDAAQGSAGQLQASAQFSDGASTTVAFPKRVGVTLPSVSAAFSWKPPLYTLTGTASFYDNGTTAMRIPRGTVIVICGAAGCIERVVNDYGPSAAGGRLIDMYRPDFFAICGCPSWSGLTQVTVKVYGIP
ncbi:MAG TPA: hypothetical protein VKR30_05815 [Candidatus Limnocylindrales bacterium]|nr:hypothetical protein [Candidatus Limnocylindrales bacterium]